MDVHVVEDVVHEVWQGVCVVGFDALMPRGDDVQDCVDLVSEVGAAEVVCRIKHAPERSALRLARRLLSQSEHHTRRAVSQTYTLAMTRSTFSSNIQLSRDDKETHWLPHSMSDSRDVFSSW